MKKLAGVVVVLLLLYVALLATVPNARRTENHTNIARRIGQYGIISLGAGTLIISGGIDLSMGSFVGLSATILAYCLTVQKMSPAAAIAVVGAIGGVAGTIHGLLVTKLRLQPFVVTLCGLFVYRGLARWLAGDANPGLGNGFLEFREAFSLHEFGPLPVEFLYLLAAVVVFGILLHRSVYGRYLFAIGSNETAARYSGIPVDRYKILAYVLCSLSGAFFAVMYLAEHGGVQPSNTGAFLELYAIAGAVLGGCSLRGGDGNVFGIVAGTAILAILKTAVTFWEVPDALEYAAIGGALLFGAILDEFLRRRGPAVRAGS
jgi:ribose transport system permease protein